MTTIKKGPIRYFTGIRGGVAVLIPKKRGVGHLKSPFGGHHANGKYHAFRDINIKGLGDSIDIDGYLFVEIRYSSHLPEFDVAIEAIMKSLNEIFDQSEGYEEIGSEFWDIIK